MVPIARGPRRVRVAAGPCTVVIGPVTGSLTNSVDGRRGMWDDEYPECVESFEFLVAGATLWSTQNS